MTCTVFSDCFFIEFLKGFLPLLVISVLSALVYFVRKRREDFNSFITLYYQLVSLYQDIMSLNVSETVIQGIELDILKIRKFYQDICSRDGYAPERYNTPYPYDTTTLRGKMLFDIPNFQLDIKSVIFLSKFDPNIIAILNDINSKIDELKNLFNFLNRESDKSSMILKEGERVYSITQTFYIYLYRLMLLIEFLIKKIDLIKNELDIKISAIIPQILSDIYRFENSEYIKTLKSGMLKMDNTNLKHINWVKKIWLKYIYWG